MIGCCTEHPGVNNNMKQNFLPFFNLPSKVNMDHRFNELPVELREYLIQYLDQSAIIRDLRGQLRIMLEKYEVLRRNNQRLTLQVIQQINDIRNLEFILANGLDTEGRDLARRLNFDTVSDSDDETVYTLSDSEEVDV
jgi:protein subunit release factor B